MEFLTKRKKAILLLIHQTKKEEKPNGNYNTSTKRKKGSRRRMRRNNRKFKKITKKGEINGINENFKSRHKLELIENQSDLNIKKQSTKLNKLLNFYILLKILEKTENNKHIIERKRLIKMQQYCNISFSTR